MDKADADALTLLEGESHGYQLHRLSRETNIIDLPDCRLKEFIRGRLGKADRRGPIGFDVYACRVGRKQCQFGTTISEAVRAAIKGAPIR